MGLSPTKSTHHCYAHFYSVVVAKVYSNKQEHSNYYYDSTVSKVDSGGSAAEAPFGPGPRLGG